MEIDKDLKFQGNKEYAPATCTIVTHKQNMIGVVSRQSGRKTSKLKLLTNDVSTIVDRKRAGETTRTLAEEYGVSISTINTIYRNAC